MSVELLSSDNKEATQKKIPCRYGRGCTHIQDPFHKERYDHPEIPVLEKEDIRNNYICNECGFAFGTLDELRIHLQRKTAWSNKSLIGCRVSCLMDKEWHEGFVIAFKPNGKHCVDFRSYSEKKWIHMTKVAFYIVEHPENPSQPQNQTLNGEFKENDGDAEEEFIFMDEISKEFAFAQSVLFKIYGGAVQETGHKTKGHSCLTERDRLLAKSMKGSFLYGELLPRGANKALGPLYLRAGTANTLFDLGMGTGKVAIQAFLQFRNLTYVFGIELANGRYCVAEDAVMAMVNLLGTNRFRVDIIPGKRIVVTEIATGEDSASQRRILHLECGNMLNVKNVEIADVVMLETDIPQNLHEKLCEMLGSMKIGSRTLSYHDLQKIWSFPHFPFVQIDINVPISDRFPTSWSVQRGHHFYVWNKMSNMEQPPSQLHKIEQNNTSMDCTVPNTDTAVKLEESVVEYASLPVTLDKSFSETPAGVSLQNATHPPPSPSTDMTSSPSACLPGLYFFLQYFQCSFFSVNKEKVVPFDKNKQLLSSEKSKERNMISSESDNGLS